VGLIQRLVEEAGIPTISIGNDRARIERIKPPRVAHVRFPRGSMFGEPGHVARQRRVVLDLLGGLKTMTTPGEILQLPYRWNR